MDKDDTILAVEIKEGNAKSFNDLYERYHKQLYYLARHYLKDSNLAEDAVQDTFLKLWNKRQSLDSSSIEGYLFTILKNHVLNMIRDERNRKQVVKEIKRMAKNKKNKNIVEEEIVYSEYKRFLEKALVKLSPAQREVFKLRSFERLSNAEVAKKRDVSENTVKTQYYLGSKFVRDFLKKHSGLVGIAFLFLWNIWIH